MWLFALCSLVLAQGTLAEDDCSKRSFGECVRPTLYKYIPQEISEYNTLCPQLPNYLKCLRDHQKQCEPDVVIYMNDAEYNRVYEAYSDLCKEGTFLNQVATENLKCLNETFSTTACPEEAKAVTGPFRSPEGEEDYSLPIEIMCLEVILQINCIASDIGRKCGDSALEATLELMSRVDFLKPICGKENAKILMRGLEVFTLNQRQKEVVVATLEKIIMAESE